MPEMTCPACEAALPPGELPARCPECGHRLKKSKTEAPSSDITSGKPGAAASAAAPRPKKKRRPKRIRREQAEPPGWLDPVGLLIALAAAALMLGVSLGTAALVRLTGTRPDAKQSASAAPEDSPSRPKPEQLTPTPGVSKKLPKPVKGPIPWTAHPDAPPAPVAPRTVADGPGLPVNGDPLFASGDGLFVVDTPERGSSTSSILQSREPAALPVHDLGTGKSFGTISRTAPRGCMAVLSPTGLFLATQGTASAGAATPVAIWLTRLAKPPTLLPMPGGVFWMDFSSPTELLVLCCDREHYRLQVWNLERQQLLRDLGLPPEIFPPAPAADQLAFRPDRLRGAISSGGRYVALGAPSGIALVSLADGALVGLLRLREGEEHPHYRGLRFSADGSELTGVIGLRRRNTDSTVNLRTWKMADGSLALDAALAEQSLFGPPLSGAQPDTVLLTRQKGEGDGAYSVGFEVDKRTGATVRELPYSPVQWLKDSRLLAVGPIKDAPPNTPLPPGMNMPIFGTRRTGQRDREAWERQQRADPAVRAVYAVKIEAAPGGSD